MLGWLFVNTVLVFLFNVSSFVHCRRSLIWWCEKKEGENYTGKSHTPASKIILPGALRHRQQEHHYQPDNDDRAQERSVAAAARRRGSWINNMKEGPVGISTAAAAGAATNGTGAPSLPASSSINNPLGMGATSNNNGSTLNVTGGPLSSLGSGVTTAVAASIPGLGGFPFSRSQPSSPAKMGSLNGGGGPLVDYSTDSSTTAENNSVENFATVAPPVSSPNGLPPAVNGLFPGIGRTIGLTDSSSGLKVKLSVKQPKSSNGKPTLPPASPVEPSTQPLTLAPPPPPVRAKAGRPPKQNGLAAASHNHHHNMEMISSTVPHEGPGAVVNAATAAAAAAVVKKGRKRSNAERKEKSAPRGRAKSSSVVPNGDDQSPVREPPAKRTKVGSGFFFKIAIPVSFPLIRYFSAFTIVFN